MKIYTLIHDEINEGDLFSSVEMVTPNKEEALAKLAEIRKEEFDDFWERYKSKSQQAEDWTDTPELVNVWTDGEACINQMLLRIDECDVPISEQVSADNADVASDKAVFQFYADTYSRKTISNLTREECEHLSYKDEDNVTKINIDSVKDIENLLNDDALDTANSFYRIFL